MKNFNTLLTLSELKEHYGSPPVGICTLYYGKLDKTIVESKTGNPIVLPPYKAITSLNISFSPQQAGSGDPSPENIRPISGWDSLSVTRCGKNLLKFNQNSPQITKNENLKDGDIVVGCTSNAYVYSHTISDLTIENGRLSFISAVSGYGVGIIIYLPVGTEFNVSGNELENGRVAYTWVSNERKLVSRSSDTIVKGTVPDGMLGICVIMRPLEIASVTSGYIQAELGSTPTAYEPYQGTTATITFPETIYGGTVDAVTGEGEKTWGYIASYNGESLPGEWISDRDVYASGTTPTTGAQVAYKLATPKPFKVNPISIPSLSGINTIYSDADNLSCDFKISSFWGDAD